METDVNDWAKSQFRKINLIKHKDYNEESAMSEYLKTTIEKSLVCKSDFGYKLRTPLNA
ncbi:hypothetical protein [Enterococcus rotai]|uniref:hypothetical protein n=1 Tax=Enterococcus rotai TaxID=118060 RepID=UPI0035C7392C